jgi:hypothetical protein
MTRIAKRTRRRFAKRCVARANREAHEALYYLPHYSEGSLGREVAELQLAYADLWFEIGKAIYPEWEREAE